MAYPTAEQQQTLAEYEDELGWPCHFKSMELVSAPYGYMTAIWAVEDEETETIRMYELLVIHPNGTYESYSLA